MADDERRTAERFTVWIPLQLELDSAQRGPALAVSRNISESGALLLLEGPLEAGEPIAVRFCAPGQPEQQVHGLVVRCGPNEEDPTGLWPSQVAVAFDEPVPELEAIVKALVDEDAP